MSFMSGCSFTLADHPSMWCVAETVAVSTHDDTPFPDWRLYRYWCREHARADASPIACLRAAAEAERAS